MTVYFGFAVADGMFPADCEVSRRKLALDEVEDIIATGVVSCLNPSHTATIDAMSERYGIDIPIPETPPRVTLAKGDSVVVMAVRGLPRLTDRHEYTHEEIAEATFAFGIWTVVSAP